MELLKKDKLFIEKNYEQFVQKLVILLKASTPDNLFQHFEIFEYWLNEGLLSNRVKPNFSTNYDYISFSNIDKMCTGIQVFTGTYCCRHVNALLFDILSRLGYECTISYFYISEDNNWKMLENGCGSNHVYEYD